MNDKKSSTDGWTPIPDDSVEMDEMRVAIGEAESDGDHAILFIMQKAGYPMCYVAYEDMRLMRDLCMSVAERIGQIEAMRRENSN